MDERKPAAETRDAEHYGAEVLCANWNPVAMAVVEPPSAGRGGWLLGLAASDIENFLRQFYRCQSA